MLNTLLALVIVGVATISSPKITDDIPDPFKDYRGKEPVPAGLKEAYTGFVRSARGGSVAAYLLPQAVNTSQALRPEKTREYGNDINEDFLKKGFSPEVQFVRKEEGDCYLLRTGTSGIWFVQTKSGVWKVYRYFDKPIQ